MTPKRIEQQVNFHLREALKMLDEIRRDNLTVVQGDQIERANVAAHVRLAQGNLPNVIPPVNR